MQISQAVCQLCERSTRASKATTRKKDLQSFFGAYSDDDFFPLMRLLLPQLDKERQTYGMKESVLAKLYVQILGISPESDDGKRLIHWRRPNGGTRGAQTAEAGDFGTAVYESLKKRCPEKGDMSVFDINAALDSLNAAADKNEKTQTLKVMLRRTTALEQKWLVRVILKELKMGSSEKTILNYFHPDAVELFNITSNLRRVCHELKDPTTTLSARGAGLFQPVKPMLAARKAPESVVKLMEGRPFVIENKFDGERVQVHKDGKTIKLFSRNSNDITAIYGPTVIPMLQECIGVARCIIDGELLVWDTLAGRFEDFGKLKSLAHYEREKASGSLSSQTATLDLANNFGKQFCYIAFDLLYVNDRSVMSLTGEQRMLMLKRCIKPKEKVVEIVAQKPASTTEEIVNALDAAILNREEGIMIKDMESTYVPNERKNKWIKLKPEYVDGVGDDLDLIILGGYYGTGLGRRGGTISHFLLGVAAQREESTDGSGKPTLFYSFCKVGSGYSDNELRLLQKMLEKHWKPFNAQSPPACFQLQGVQEKPDVWLDPRHSRIVQVKAAQVTVSEKYRAGYTLRFPRVIKIRTDKNWTQCMDLTELVSLAQEFSGRYAKRRAGPALERGEGNGGGDAEQKKKRRSGPSSRRGVTLGRQFQDTDVSTIAVKTDLFAGLQFCVITGDEEKSKSELETLIHEYGGHKVQYPGPQTFCAIAGRETLKVKNMAACGMIDIVHYRWLNDCTALSQRLPLEPKYMIFTLPETKRRFLKEIDKYGDSYTKETDVQNLKEAFAMLVKLQKEEQLALSKAHDNDDDDNDQNANASESDLNSHGRGVGLKKRKRPTTEARSKEEAEEVNLKRKRVEELKALLKELDLRVSGAKEELVQRILDCKYRGLRATRASKRVKKETDDDGVAAAAADLSSAAVNAQPPAKAKSASDDDEGDDDGGRVADLAALERKYFWAEENEVKPWWAIFRDYVAYFDRYAAVSDVSTTIACCGLDVSAALFVFYGGTLSETIHAGVTHVVVDTSDPTRLDEIQSQVAQTTPTSNKTRPCHVVSKEWVEESAASHDDLDEREFYVLGEQFHALLDV